MHFYSTIPQAAVSLFFPLGEWFLCWTWLSNNFDKILISFFSGKHHASTIASTLGMPHSLRLVIDYSDWNLNNSFEDVCSIMMASFCLSMAEKINLWHQKGFRGFFKIQYCFAEMAVKWGRKCKISRAQN